MIRGPRTLAGRLVLAFLAAVAGIVALEWWQRGRAALAAGLRAPAAGAGSAPLAPAPGAPLAVRAATVVLASALASCPADAAPVVQVLADGRTAVRRPPPLPAAPGPTFVARAGLLLPARSLADLSPAQRAAVLDLLGQLLPERPASPARVLLADVGGGPADLAMLLGWLR